MLRVQAAAAAEAEARAQKLAQDVARAAAAARLAADANNSLAVISHLSTISRRAWQAFVLCSVSCIEAMSH